MTTIRIGIILGRTKIDRDTPDAPKNPKPRDIDEMNGCAKVRGVDIR
jgi:hypothetical protein